MVVTGGEPVARTATSCVLGPARPRGGGEIARCYAPRRCDAADGCCQRERRHRRARSHQLAGSGPGRGGAALTRRRRGRVAAGGAAAGSRRELAGASSTLRPRRERATRSPREAGPRRVPVQGAGDLQSPPTRATSSGASGWWRSSSPGSSGAPLLGVVGPSGSGKSSVVRAGLLAALSAACSRAASAGPRPCSARATPLRAMRRAVSSAPGRRFLLVRRPVRGGLHGLPRRGASAPRSSTRARRRSTRAGARWSCSPSAPTTRALRREPRARRPARRQPRARRPDGRATSSATRSSGPREGRARRSNRKLTDALHGRRRVQPGALPLLSTALLELWQHRDGRTLRATPPTSAPAACTARSRGSPRTPTGGSTRQQPLARRMLLQLVGRGRRRYVVRRRVALAELDERQDARGRRRPSPLAAC